MESIVKQTPFTSSPRGNVLLQALHKNYLIYLIMLPGVLFFLIFSYIPMLGLIIAFQDYNPLKGFMSKFIGFKNFEFFFTSNDWLKVTFNTLYLNFLFIVAGTVFPIFIAILITEIRNRIFAKVNQSIIILPHFISWPVVSMFIIAFFATDGGVVNQILVGFGIEKINFTTRADLWPPLLVLMRVWKEAGFSAILYIATIASIDTELYEAARMDGASRIRCIMHITIPLLKKTVILLTLLALGRIFFGDFGMIYAIVGDNATLYSTTDVIDTYVFRALRLNGDFGMSAAVGFYQSLIGFVLILSVNALAKKYDKETALF
jgi:putative aldouronate transport system permease protein